MQSFFSRYLEFCYQGIPIFLKPFDESNDIWIYECVLSLILFIELFSHFGSCQHWINRHTCFGLLQNNQSFSGMGTGRIPLSLSLSQCLMAIFKVFLICFWREKKGDVFLIPLLPLLTACEWELKNHRPICFVGGIFNSILSYVEEGLTSHKVFFFQ